MMDQLKDSTRVHINNLDIQRCITERKFYSGINVTIDELMLNIRCNLEQEAETLETELIIQNVKFHS